MKKNNFVLLLASSICLILLATSCNAQIPTDELKKTNTNSSKQIGEYIFEIFEDSKGNLWLGTGKNGVAKYDGKSLTFFSEEDGLCGRTVANIAEDKDGNIWFGTHMDLCKFRDNAFQTLPRKDGYPILGWGWKDLGAGWKSVRSNKDQSIWVNSHHGIFHCDDPTLPIDQLTFSEFKVPVDTNLSRKYCNTPGAVSLDLEDSKGNFWFGTDGDGVYKYDGESFTHYNKEDGLLTDNVTAISEDAQGNIWIACVQELTPSHMNNGGICRFNSVEKNFTHFPQLKGLNKNNVYTIYSDKSGNIWVGANGTGVYRYSASETIADEKRFTLFSEPKEAILENNTHTPGLQSVLEDSKGQMWFGYSGGLFRLEGNSIVNVTIKGPW